MINVQYVLYDVDCNQWIHNMTVHEKIAPYLRIDFSYRIEVLNVIEYFFSMHILLHMTG